MKNKKLLMLFLATLSVSAVGAVAATGCNSEHEHAYTWHSDSEKHWEECDCGDKKDSADHIDVKNNETGADGKDGKCDVCDYEIKQVVTFDMLGRGVAPETQNVDYGEKAVKPADPADDDAYIFSGWCKDAACETAFDFESDVVTDNITLYAKWVENKTPGESMKYAFEVELDNPMSTLKPLTSKGYTYYKFTAVQDGRYTISLATGANSQKCYFATDADDFDAYYGNGHDNSTICELFTKESIYVKLFCDEDLDDEATVGIALNAVYNEPLPADNWFEGLYINGAGSTSFALDRTNNQLTYNGNAYGFNYLAGKFDTLYFDTDNDSIQVKHKGDAFVLTAANGNNSVNLVHVAKPETPALVGDFSGTYVPATSGATSDGISKISIDEDGTGYYLISAGGSSGTYTRTFDSANFDSEYGLLTFGMYTFMLNTDGETKTLKVFGGTGETFVTYTRTGDAIPAKIKLSSGTHEFVGQDFSLTDNGNSQYWNDDINKPIVVTDYVKAENKYTVSLDGNVYVLKVITNDAIEVYDETGANLLDTLERYVVDYVNLPADAAAEISLDTSKFKKNFYHFVTTEAGWYTFNSTDENLEVYTGINKYTPTFTEEGVTKLDFSDGAVTVYLSVDTVVGVKSLYTDNKPATVSLTVGTGTAPKGFDENNPLAINGLGETEVGFLVDKYYLTFTPPKAGSYIINVSYVLENGNVSNYLNYTVDGNKAGYDYSSWKFVGGVTASVPYYTLEVTDTAPVTIVIVGESRRDYATGNNIFTEYNNVKITIAEDYKVGAKNVEFVEGAPVDKVITASATVSGAGTYIISDTGESVLTITANSEFTAKVHNADIEVVNVGGVYTATVPAGTDIYVTVSAAVTFSISYPEPEKADFGHFKADTDFGELILYFDENMENATMSVGGENLGAVTISGSNGNYTISYDGSYTATLTMGANGLYTFEDDYFGTHVLAVYHPAPAAYDYAYSGRTNHGNMIQLTVNFDFTAATLTINGVDMTNVTITAGATQGEYTLSFVDSYDYENVATLTDSWEYIVFSEPEFYGSGTLNPVEG